MFGLSNTLAATMIMQLFHICPVCWGEGDRNYLEDPSGLKHRTCGSEIRCCTTETRISWARLLEVDRNCSIVREWIQSVYEICSPPLTDAFSRLPSRCSWKTISCGLLFIHYSVIIHYSFPSVILLFIRSCVC